MSIKPKKNPALVKLEKIIGSKLTLGVLINSIRQSEEYTQVEFAKKLKISKQYLCDIEKGRRFISPKMAAEYAKILGYSADQFVRLCLQDMLDRDGIKMVVELKVA